MAITIKVKGKDVEIKFNYRLLFLANKKLGSKDKNGVNQEDGAANLFNNIMDRKESAIHNLIELASKDKLTENDLIDAVSDYTEEHGFEETFKEIENEMLNSGFFLPKIQKQIQDMKFSLDLLKEKKTEESQDQVRAIKAMTERLEKRISLHSAQGKG